MTLRLLDVFGPAGVLVDGIDAEADHLDVALPEIRLELGHIAELSRADGCEVLGMREDDAPGIAEPVIELDMALGRVGFEVGRGCADG
jgi:hypothetical protein